jgi:hypothetical protein
MKLSHVYPGLEFHSPYICIPLYLHNLVPTLSLDFLRNLILSSFRPGTAARHKQVVRGRMSCEEDIVEI